MSHFEPSAEHSAALSAVAIGKGLDHDAPMGGIALLICHHPLHYLIVVIYT